MRPSRANETSLSCLLSVRNKLQNQTKLFIDSLRNNPRYTYAIKLLDLLSHIKPLSPLFKENSNKFLNSDAMNIEHIPITNEQKAPERVILKANRFQEIFDLRKTSFEVGRLGGVLLDRLEDVNKHWD